jgi:hypothetical protein
MTSLLDTQRAFTAALHGDFGQLQTVPVREHGIAAEKRFQVYRHNLQATYVAALQSTYPVVAAIVGDDFFDYAARQYVRQHSSWSGDLNDYGDRFARFVAGLPQTKHLPYLEDVAHLEWAMQEVARAAEPGLFNARGLARVPPARYPELRFELHPASRLLFSPYPLLAIWRLHHSSANSDVTVNLEAGSVRLLVIRRQDIELEPLSRGEHEMLSALAAGDPFAAAAESALAVDPDFDVTVSLRDHVARRTIVDFYF